ncbi:hypothetical protein [Streptomyces xanthophaeus]|uniref:hypothetical protein n=1 Tax=Streptomyces xanthophaeus TaxID=67385 RepID=UPI0004CCCEFC|nr:hypothetical protein [Streptomyces xanthophaeus]
MSDPPRSRDSRHTLPASPPAPPTGTPPEERDRHVSERLSSCAALLEPALRDGSSTAAYWTAAIHAGGSPSPNTYTDVGALRLNTHRGHGKR